jgi:hypothetical protein
LIIDQSIKYNFATLCTNNPKGEEIVIEGRDSLKGGERERNLENMVRQPSVPTLKKVQSKHYLSGTSLH